MRLEQWITEQTATLGAKPAQVKAKLAYDSGISIATISNICQGLRIKRGDVAQALSNATAGAVTVREIME